MAPVSTATTPLIASEPTHSAAGRRERIIIIGAGITGLVLSARLARRGVPHIVLERAQLAGGVIHTCRVGGDILEDGPQRTRLTPSVHALVRELGLEPVLLTAPPHLPLLVYRAGALRLAPLSLSQLVRTDLLSAGARLRLLAEPFTAPLRVDETVASYFTRRFGRAAYEHLLGPLFGGLYGSDPSDMFARHALRAALDEMGAAQSAVVALSRRALQRRASPPACSFRDGMQTLTDTLFGRVREYVRLATPAVRLERAGNGFRVHAGDAVLSARAVVLTCPAGAAAVLLGDITPAVGVSLATLAYNRLAVVHLRSGARLEALGFQTSLAERLRTRGVTFNHALFGRQGIYTAFLGGARDPDLIGRSDAEVGAVASEDFRQVTGHDAEVLRVTRTAIPAWDRTWIALDGLQLPTGVHLCANYESRIGIPGRIQRAVELADAL